MQRFILTSLLATALFPCSRMLAQRYHVFDVKGDVCTVYKNKKEKVRRQQVLDKHTRICVPEEACLVLIDSLNHKSYKISRCCNGTVKALTASRETHIDNLSKQYFKYLWKQMYDPKSIKTTINETGESTTYRDTDTSIKVTKEPHDTVTVAEE